MSLGQSTAVGGSRECFVTFGNVVSTGMESWSKKSRMVCR